jgi:hypothetical protein
MQYIPEGFLRTVAPSGKSILPLTLSSHKRLRQDTLHELRAPRDWLLLPNPDFRDELSERPLTNADSTDRRNRLMKSFSGRLVV